MSDTALVLPSRRGFLASLGAALVAAPAVVRAASIMLVRSWVGDGVALTSMAHPNWPIETRDDIPFGSFIVSGYDGLGKKISDVLVINRPSGGVTMKSFSRITSISGG